MLQFFISIPGPLFLLVYLLYLVVGIFLLAVWLDRVFSKPSTSRPPDLSAAKLSPYAVAQLREPEQGPAELALYELWRANLVNSHSFEGGHFLKKKPYQPNKPKQANKAGQLSPIGRAAYKLLDEPISFKTFASRLGENPLLLKEIEPLLKHKLFLPEEELVPESRKIQTWVIVAGCLLLMPGVLKFCIGLMHDKPVLFLGIEIVLATLIMLIIFFSSRLDNPQPTPRGQALLANLQKKNQWLLSGIRERYKVTEDMSLAVALFGRRSIAYIPAFAGFYELAHLIDPPPVHSSPYYNHSSAGGDSSGGSGGGEGGGGGCGGGCGGCGGCGG